MSAAEVEVLAGPSSPATADPALSPGAGSALEIATEPSSLVQVESQCAAVEAWAETVDSIPTIKDASNRLAAIDEYLARTSTDGRARVAAAMRRLEVRIGELVGPPPSPQETGARKGFPAGNPSDDDGLSKKERSQFRAMAKDKEAVEKAIAESTDQNPPSRRKVFSAVEEARNLDALTVLVEAEQEADA